MMWAFFILAELEIPLREGFSLGRYLVHGEHLLSNDRYHVTHNRGYPSGLGDRRSKRFSDIEKVLP